MINQSQSLTITSRSPNTQSAPGVGQVESRIGLTTALAPCFSASSNRLRARHHASFRIHHCWKTASRWAACSADPLRVAQPGLLPRSGSWPDDATEVEVNDQRRLAARTGHFGSDFSLATAFPPNALRVHPRTASSIPMAPVGSFAIRRTSFTCIRLKLKRWPKPVTKVSSVA